MPKLPQKFTKAKEKQKSPSNSRNIPESSAVSIKETKNWILKEWKVLLVSFFAGILLTGIGYTAVDIYKQVEALNAQTKERMVLYAEAAKWERIVKAHPDYRDGYFQLALLQYQMGEKEKARINLEKTLQLDPNYEKAVQLMRQFDLK